MADLTQRGSNIVQRAIIQRVFGIPFNSNFPNPSAAGAVTQVSYTISTNFNFLWEMTQIYSISSNTQILATRDFQINIRDEFTSEDMFTSGVWASTITGVGQHQFILPRPYMFLGGTTITLTFTDVIGSAAVTQTNQILLMGYKVKKVG